MSLLNVKNPNSAVYLQEIATYSGLELIQNLTLDSTPSIVFLKQHLIISVCSDIYVWKQTALVRRTLSGTHTSWFRVKQHLAWWRRWKIILVPHEFAVLNTDVRGGEEERETEKERVKERERLIDRDDLLPFALIRFITFTGFSFLILEFEVHYRWRFYLDWRGICLVSLWTETNSKLALFLWGFTHKALLPANIKRL